MISLQDIKDSVGVVGGVVGLVSGGLSWFDRWRAKRQVEVQRLTASVRRQGNGALVLTFEYDPLERHEGFRAFVRLRWPNDALIAPAERKYDNPTLDALVMRTAESRWEAVSTASRETLAEFREDHEKPPTLSVTFLVSGEFDLALVEVTVVVTTKVSMKRRIKRTMIVSPMD